MEYILAGLMVALVVAFFIIVEQAAKVRRLKAKLNEIKN